MTSFGIQGQTEQILWNSIQRLSQRGERVFWHRWQKSGATLNTLRWPSSEADLMSLWTKRSRLQDDTSALEKWFWLHIHLSAAALPSYCSPLAEEGEEVRKSGGRGGKVNGRKEKVSWSQNTAWCELLCPCHCRVLAACKKNTTDSVFEFLVQHTHRQHTHTHSSTDTWANTSAGTRAELELK